MPLGQCVSVQVYLRKFSFVNLKEWNDEGGNRIYIAGFTNKKDGDLKKEFGQEFDYNNESGQKRELLSVSQFAPMFEKPRTSRQKKQH